jgi:hypothetical protein
MAIQPLIDRQPGKGCTASHAHRAVAGRSGSRRPARLATAPQRIVPATATKTKAIKVVARPTREWWTTVR